MSDSISDRIDMATRVVKLARELTATTLMFFLAAYLSFVMVAEVRIILPKIAHALEVHVATTDTGELTRLSRLQCQALKALVKQDPGVCERKVVLPGS